MNINPPTEDDFRTALKAANQGYALSDTGLPEVINNLLDEIAVAKGNDLKQRRLTIDARTKWQAIRPSAV